VRLEVGVFVEEEDGALAESELFMEGIEESLSQGGTEGAIDGDSEGTG
jgi:hypothetical protein